MAVKVTYRIRSSKGLSKKSDEYITLHARLTDGRKADVSNATPFSIPFRYWDDKNGRIKDSVILEDEKTAKYLEELEAHLKNLRISLITDYSTKSTYSKSDMALCMSNYMESLQMPVTTIPTDIVEYLAYCIDGMKDGSRRNKGERYDADTIKAWGSFKLLIKTFCEYYLAKEKKKLGWDDIDVHVYNHFLSFLEEKGYMKKTINKYIVSFKTMVSFALDDEIHSNAKATQKFYKVAVREDEQAYRTYLTDSESQALYALALEEGSMECKVRDVFLSGVYTGQRISDYKKLDESNFTRTKKGTRVVVLTQEKTNKKVIIPILNDNLLVIAKKYNFDFPEVNDQVLNRYIKRICKRLSETVPSLQELLPTVLTMKEKEKEAKGEIVYEKDKQGRPLKHRYDLIMSHTARRSCITNLYLTGQFDTKQLMSISGHTTEKNFYEYLCCSDETIAEEIDKKIKALQSKTNEDLF